MKRKWYLIPAALVLACVLFAGIVRVSYTDTVAGELHTYLFLPGGENWDAVFQKNGIQSPEDLPAQADVIVKARFDGERRVRSNAFYSAVSVEEVYRGEKSLAGTSILVTESISTFQSTRFLNGAMMPMWVPLHKGAEYVLLLKHVPFAKERALNGFQSRQYFPVTNTPAGCYLLEHGKRTGVVAKQDCTTDDLAGYAFYTQDPQQADAYYAIKEAVFKKLGLSDS